VNGPTTTSRRRELAAAVVGAAVAGGLALMAGGQTWARVIAERRAPLPPVTGMLTGGNAAPLVPATGLVLLAAAIALVAVSGWARTAVGLLAAAAGAALAWSGVRALTGGLMGGSTELPGVGRVTGAVTVDVSAAWPLVAVLAGVIGVLTGLVVVLRSRGWPGMGRRYQRGAAPPSRSEEDRAQAAWTALDRGEDPTV
jgi:uncharacterized membrane protein (TIGR02234 family)